MARVNEDGRNDDDQAAEHRPNDGTRGQPIGGDDSRTGSGTPLTQAFAGAAPGAAGPAGYASGRDETAVTNDHPTGSGENHEAKRSGEPAADSFARGTSNAVSSAIAVDQTSVGSSGVSGGKEFIGSIADDVSEPGVEDEAATRGG